MLFEDSGRKFDGLDVRLFHLANHDCVSEQETRHGQKSAEGNIKPVPRVFELSCRHGTVASHFDEAKGVVRIVLAKWFFLAIGTMAYHLDLAVGGDEVSLGVFGCLIDLDCRAKDVMALFRHQLLLEVCLEKNLDLALQSSCVDVVLLFDFVWDWKSGSTRIELDESVYIARFDHELLHGVAAWKWHLFDDLFRDLVVNRHKCKIVNGELPAIAWNCKFLEAALIAPVVPLATLRMLRYSRVGTLPKMYDLECAICFVLIDKLDRWWKDLRIDQISFHADTEASELIPYIKRRVVLSKIFFDISL